MEETTQIKTHDIQAIDSALDEYELSVGIPKTDIEKLSPITEYLNMSRDTIESLAPLDCGSIAYMLRQHAFHLQRAYNRELSRMSYAKSSIDRIVCKDIGNYHGSWETTRQLAILHDEVASKLQKIEQAAKLRADRLTFIGKTINDLADTLLKIQQIKGAKHD